MESAFFMPEHLRPFGWPPDKSGETNLRRSLKNLPQATFLTRWINLAEQLCARLWSGLRPQGAKAERIFFKVSVEELVNCMCNSVIK